MKKNKVEDLKNKNDKKESKTNNGAIKSKIKDEVQNLKSKDNKSKITNDKLNASLATS
jgi:hypothetical protein